MRSPLMVCDLPLYRNAIRLVMIERSYDSHRILRTIIEPLWFRHGSFISPKI